MKKIQLKKGLKIKKEEITKLQESQMARITGGIAESCHCKSCGKNVSFASPEDTL